MSQEPRTNPWKPTLLRLDCEAREMLDEYAAAHGCKLHEGAAQMIATAYAEWQAERPAAGSLSGKGYGPFGRCAS